MALGDVIVDRESGKFVLDTTVKEILLTGTETINDILYADYSLELQDGTIGTFRITGNDIVSINITDVPNDSVPINFVLENLIKILNEQDNETLILTKAQEVSDNADAIATTVAPITPFLTELETVSVNINTVVIVGGIESEIIDIASEPLRSAILDATSEPLRSKILEAEQNAEDAESALEDFKNRYYGTSLTEPNNRPDGSPSENGDLYFDLNSYRMRIFTGIIWISAGSSISGLITVVERVALEGQVLFSGLTYDVGSIIVYRNGYRLSPSLYTAVDSTTVTLHDACAINDEIVFESLGAFDQTQFQSILSDIVDNANAIQSVVNETVVNTNNIAINSSDISTISNSVTQLITDVAQNSSDVAANLALIVSNTTDIATNTANIIQNALDIAINEGTIVDNATDISSNLASILANTASIVTNVTDILSIDTRVSDLENNPKNGLDKYGVDTSSPLLTLSGANKYNVKTFLYYIDGIQYTLPAGNDISPSFNGAGEFQILYVDSDEVLKKKVNSFLTAGELTSAIEVGRIATDDGINIIPIGTSAFLLPELMRNLYLRWKIFEGTKFDGDAGLVSEYGTNQLQISGGFVSDPNGSLITIPSSNQLNVFPIYSISGINGIRTLQNGMVVQSTQYNDGTDLAAIPNNQFVSHTLLRSMSTGRYYIEYGRIVYGSLLEARLGITENNLFSQSGSEVEPLAKIIVQEGSGIKAIEDSRGLGSSQSSSTINSLGWKDNIALFSSAQGNGTTEPNWEDVGNGNYSYSWTAGEELFVAFHVDHDYALGTLGYPHIHFYCQDTQAVGNTVTWRFSYVKARGHSQGESLTTSPRTDIDITYTFDGTEIAGEHIIVECEDADAFDLLEPDTIIKARVQLLSTTATGKIFAEMADLHYQSDRESTPFKEPDFINGVI